VEVLGSLYCIIEEGSLVENTLVIFLRQLQRPEKCNRSDIPTPLPLSSPLRPAAQALASKRNRKQGETLRGATY
jgi:hypothetical protein